jgi:hypothetical protein
MRFQHFPLVKKSDSSSPQKQNPSTEPVPIFRTCGKQGKLHAAGSTLNVDGCSAGQDIPCFYGTEMFVTVFLKFRHP